VKRRQGIHSAEISSFILRELKNWAGVFSEAIERAVITGGISTMQRQATKRCGQMAGLEVVRLVNEPTAAALFFRSAREATRQWRVRLGGGTFDTPSTS
jgi:molecular chaperone DnaK (HSP70)